MGLLTGLASIPESNPLGWLFPALGLGSGETAVTRSHSETPLPPFQLTGLPFFDPLHFMEGVNFTRWTVGFDIVRHLHAIT